MKSAEVQLIHNDRQVRGEELAALSERIAQALKSRHAWAVLPTDPVVFSAAVLAARAAGRSLLLMPRGLTPTAAAELAADCGSEVLLGTSVDDVVALDGAAARGLETPSLGIFTSGTTGTPKLVLHEWARVQGPAALVPERLQRQLWLMSYAPTSYAGMQVFFSALNSGGALAFFDPPFPAVCERMAAHGVGVVSATPTFWRMLMTAWPRELPRVAIRQASFGGEAAGQDVLDQVAAFFEPERLTHIYASTEVGTALVVSDGREGFPIDWLDKAGPVQVRIVGGVLEVRSAHAMRRYHGQVDLEADSWFRTPDRAEVRGDRIVIVGREDGVINIGGTKIAPEAVEQSINSLVGVVDSCVYRRANPITGALLAADVVVAESADLTVATLKASLRARLPATHVPQFIRIVDRLAVTPSGKKLRQNG